eukprot:2260170-Prymnesium_polylepis.1
MKSLKRSHTTAAWLAPSAPVAIGAHVSRPHAASSSESKRVVRCATHSLTSGVISSGTSVTTPPPPPPPPPRV